MMARIPARVTNIIFRLAERGDGGTGGPARSRPPVIDLANNRLISNFILPMRLELHPSKFPARRGVASASWLPVSRIRSSPHLAAPSLANFEFERTLEFHD